MSVTFAEYLISRSELPSGTATLMEHLEAIEGDGGDIIINPNALIPYTELVIDLITNEDLAVIELPNNEVVFDISIQSIEFDNIHMADIDYNELEFNYSGGLNGC